MSIPTAPEYAPTNSLPQYQPPAPKRNFNWKLAATGFAAVLIGGFVGSALTPPKTPTACIVALDLNEDAFGYLSDSLGHILDGNYTAANRSTEKVKELSPEINAAKDECRASK